MIKAVNYDTIYINIKRLFFIFQQCFCEFLGFTEVFAVPSLYICSSLFIYWKWGELFSYFFGRVFIWNQVLRD